jgi:hypothetical protein
VTIDKFDPSHVLVNINKLKSYIPYDGNTRGVVSTFQRGKREGTTLETHETLKESVEDKRKIKQMKETVASKKKHKIPYTLLFHQGR